MFQGTGSNVGKSMLVAGLCRLFARKNLAVRPFKPQNMSNNAAVTADGGEIGRAQALQARAAGVPLSVHMNPVLLKPQTEIGAQVIVQGKMFGTCQARDYHKMKPKLLPYVLDSYEKLQSASDLSAGGRRRQPGRGQSARRRHRQYGLCRGGRPTRDPDRRHRPRWRHRLSGGHPYPPGTR